LSGSDVLPVELQGEALVPQFLTAADDPWVERLMEEVVRFEGKPRKKLDAHFRAGLPFDAPPRKLALARQALLKQWRIETVAAVPPRVARERTFVAGAGRRQARGTVIERVAADLDVSADQLRDALFADVPGERRLLPPKCEISVTDLRLRTNLVLVQRLLERSTRVHLQLQGNARPVIRHAKLKGLICSVLGDEQSQTTRIEISGPLSLFKRTLVYGRALAELPPQLSWCNRFYLEADVALGGGPARLILSTGAPIFPARRPKRFDSKLEERFSRDFSKATTDWDLIREPEPIPVARSLIFPDFAIVRRKPPFERWIVEIVGFWTAEYLERKLATLQLAGLERLIVCVDAQRCCDDFDTLVGAHVLPFRRKIDVQDVLAVVGG